jgi:hypothetical protein
MLFALLALFSVVSAQNAADCMQFCTDYNMTCMGAPPASTNDIYTDMQSCQNECMKFPVDTACPTGDINQASVCGSGNSYGCRRYHLNVAMNVTADPMNPQTHCPHTSPLSAPSSDLVPATAVTGTQCGMQVNGTSGKNGLVADFCNQVSPVCNKYLGGLDMTKCNTFFSHVDEATNVANYPNGVARKFPLAAITGSGLPCRRYHAQVARGSTGTEVDDHCTHALFGAGACGTTCEQYCTMGERICPAQFDANCAADCATLALGNYAVITGNNLVCRVYHMAVSAGSADAAAAHCDHSSIVSTPDTCGGASTLSVSALFLAALALITKFSS